MAFSECICSNVHMKNTEGQNEFDLSNFFKGNR